MAGNGSGDDAGKRSRRTSGDPGNPDDRATDGTDDDLDSAPAPADSIPDHRPRPTPLWALLSRWLLALEAWLRSRGGIGLRRGLRVFWGAVAAVGLILLVGPVINPPLSLDDIMESTENATDTWIARNFDADYVISQDPDGRLRAEVTETITAFFPADVDESGITRALASQYQGHDLSPTITATSIDGDPVQAAVANTADHLTVALDTGARLSGDHEFVISYTMRDLAYASTDDASGQAVDLLEWSIFGPSWPQGMSAIDVSITIPDEWADRLVREPRASLAWTLVSGGTWLHAEEDSPPGQTTFAFTNDQNIPPHAQAWFTMLFEPGTITMPPPSPLFIVQSFGPLVPLVLLLVTLLFALAARAVAWSDARGRPWFVAQHDPPQGVGPDDAAQILEVSRPRELAAAVGDVQRARKKRRDSELLTLGRAAERAGRTGDRLRALTGYLTDPARSRQLTDGFRRIPRGFVRDAFIAAPLALTVLQLGLIRQLSQQETLAVIWWPGLFVLASIVISVAVLAIGLSARPLTRRGALVKQHLRGIEVYADRTSLLERTTLDERLLPYAILTSPPREAGRRIGALVAAERGGKDVGRWRTRDFLTWPSLLIRAFALLLLAGTVALVAFAPMPYDRTLPFDNYDFDAPGTLYTQVDAVEVAGVLGMADDNRPRLDVTQTVRVDFEQDANRVPQFAQKWQATLDGQDLGMVITSVQVDGADVPYLLEHEGPLLEMTTTMARVLEGEHTVTIQYALTSPVTAGTPSPLFPGSPGVIDRVRWAALLDGYDSGWTYPSAPDPIVVSFTVSEEIAALAETSGWLRQDPDTSEEVRDWHDSVFPFGTAVDELGPGDNDQLRQGWGTLEESSDRTGDGTVHTLTVGDSDDYGYPTNSTYTDLGVMLEFPAGTFPGVDTAGLDSAAAYRAMPVVVVLALLALTVVIALVAFVRRRSRTPGPGPVRDLAWWLGPAAALSAVIVMFWTTVDVPADWPEVPVLLLGAAGAVVACVGGVYAARRPRQTRTARR